MDKQDNERRPLMNASKRPALGGLLAALILVFLSLAASFPVWDLSLFSLTSLCAAIMCIETGYKGSLILIATCGALALVFPGPLYAIIFVGFFGIYPLVKALLESRLKLWQATIIKIILATMAILGALRIYPPFREYPQHVLKSVQDLRETNFVLDQSIVLLLVVMGLIILFLIYDIALSALINIYTQRIRPNTRRGKYNR